MAKDAEQRFLVEKARNFLAAAVADCALAASALEDIKSADAAVVDAAGDLLMDVLKRFTEVKRG